MAKSWLKTDQAGAAGSVAGRRPGVCLATGVLLGLGSKWGLIRYWWVAVKLVLNLVLCTLIALVLRPGMTEVARYGKDLLTGTPDPGTVSTLFFPPAVSLSALALATALAVV